MDVILHRGFHVSIGRHWLAMWLEPTNIHIVKEIRDVLMWTIVKYCARAEVGLQSRFPKQFPEYYLTYLKNLFDK